MKKTIALVLAILMMLSVAACGKKDTAPTAPAQTQSPALTPANNNTAVTEAVQPTAASGNNPNTVTATVPSADDESTDSTQADKTPGATVATDSQSGAFDGEAVASKIKVDAVTYSSKYSNYLILLLTNNSGVGCDISGDTDFYDKSGNIVGTKSKSAYAFAPGTTIPMTFVCDDSFEKYEYSLSIKEAKMYSCVDQDLKLEVTTATNKAIVSVTNNGSKTAEYVEYTALYYSGDTVVSLDTGYVSTKLEAGKTAKKESHIYNKDFDSVKVYLHSRSEYKK